MTGSWLSLDSWERREHFKWFRAYHQPFFNVCTEVDVTRLYARTTESGGPSFFLATLHLSLRAAHQVPELRMRIRGDRVWLHERVHAGATVLREDQTFAFAYFSYDPDYARFEEYGRAVLDRVRASSGPLDAQDERDDLIHHSILPWISFTSFSHARRFDREDSIPKIVFGKHFARGDKRVLPISVEVHHALADGIHVARFLEGMKGEL